MLYCFVGAIRAHLYCGRPSPGGALDSATGLCEGCAVQCQRPECCRWALEKGCTTVQASPGANHYFAVDA